MDTMFVKPVEGHEVRDPDRGGELITDEGREVPKTPYWLARKANGHVVVSRKPSAKSRKKKSS